MKSFFVEYRTDGSVRQRWTLEVGKHYVIGRNPEKASIVIPHASMSRVHAMLEVKSDGTFSLRDLGTVNGTFFNRSKVANEIVSNISSKHSVIFAENPLSYKVVSAEPECSQLQDDKREEMGINLNRSVESSTKIKNLGNVQLLDSEEQTNMFCPYSTADDISKHNSSSSSSYSSPAHVNGKYRSVQFNYEKEHGKRNICKSPHHSEDLKDNASKNYYYSSNHSNNFHSNSNGPPLYRNMSLVIKNNTSNSSSHSSTISSTSSCTVTGNRYSTSSNVNKRKGFVSKWDDPVASPSSSAALSDDFKNLSTDDIVKFLKEKIKNTYGNINVNNAGSTGLTKQQKRKLLWGRKDTSNNVDVAVNNGNSNNNNNKNSNNNDGYDNNNNSNNNINTNKGHTELSGTYDDDPNLYGESFQQDMAKKTKFLKLMGHKFSSSSGSTGLDENLESKPDVDGSFSSTDGSMTANRNENSASVDNTNDVNLASISTQIPTNSVQNSNLGNHNNSWKSRDHLDAVKNAKIEKDLEMQFLKSLKRIDGRKTGLGL